MGPVMHVMALILLKANKSTYGRSKPNLDKHTTSRCPRKLHFNKQLNSKPFHNTDRSKRNKEMITTNLTYNFPFQLTNQTT